MEKLIEIVARDRHAEVFMALALLGTAIEQIADPERIARLEVRDRLAAVDGVAVGELHPRGVDHHHRVGRDLEQLPILRFGLTRVPVAAFEILLRLDEAFLDRRDGAAPTIANYRAGLTRVLGDKADAVFALYPAKTDADVLPMATALAGALPAESASATRRRAASAHVTTTSTAAMQPSRRIPTSPPATGRLPESPPAKPVAISAAECGVKPASPPTCTRPWSSSRRMRW